MTDSNDTGTTPPDDPAGDVGAGGEGRGRRTGVIIAVLAAVALLGVGLALLISSDDADDDDDATADTAPAETPVETEPPATEPPATEPPATEPPATEPPATEPPATEPPATEPPATEPPATEPPATDPPAAPELTFSIADIDDEGVIPVDFTCDGANQPPVVTLEAIPDGVLSMAMIVDDPDAPTPDAFVHWVVYEIPGNTAEFTDGDDGISYGLTDAGEPGWFGPCPPPGDGPHGYVFTLFGLDRELDLDDDLDGRQLADAIADAVVVEESITASYERAAA